MMMLFMLMYVYNTPAQDNTKHQFPVSLNNIDDFGIVWQLVNIQYTYWAKKLADVDGATVSAEA